MVRVGRRQPRFTQVNSYRTLSIAAVAGAFRSAAQYHMQFHEPQAPCRGSQMRGLKGLLCTTALVAPVALLPTANAQISITLGAPPACSYGYYDYSPYACAPVGYYGPGYFYNGIFLGMGPWSGWGYNHGWGSHRFSNSGGGRYTGGFHGVAANRGGGGNAPVGRVSNRSGSRPMTSAAGGSRMSAAPGGPSHNASRPTAANSGSRSPASHGGGSHSGGSGGGGSHGGGSGGGGSHGGERR
jgi:hypothetical protein